MIRRRFAAITLLVLCAAPMSAQAPDAAGTDPARVPSFLELFTELGGDFRNVVSRDNLKLFAAGSGAALLGGFHDASVSAEPPDNYTEIFEFGNELGGVPIQLGTAFAAYVVGRVVDKPKVAHVGADLVQAQLVSGVITTGLKLITQRSRPDGNDMSFPSGHTSSAFASASVLRRHFGWRVGIPAYAVASWVGASRVQERHHYLSDVLFGATIGIVSGRAVTVGHGGTRFALSPVALRGGGAVIFTHVTSH